MLVTEYGYEQHLVRSVGEVAHTRTRTYARTHTHTHTLFRDVRTDGQTDVRTEKCKSKCPPTMFWGHTKACVSRLIQLLHLQGKNILRNIYPCYDQTNIKL